MKDLREEVGTKARIVGKIVKSKTKWAGHMVRMKDEILSKISETKKHRGCRKRGNPQLRCQDCLKIELRKAEGEENGEKIPTTGSIGKRTTKVAVR